jgi:hypothetical protein
MAPANEEARKGAQQPRLQREPVRAARDQPSTIAFAAAAHGLVDGLGHTTLVVQQCAPVHHHLHVPRFQTRAALRAVRHQRQLLSVAALC